jgi:hypothetical protein
MDLFFSQPAIVIDYGLALLLAELLPVGVHVCSPAVPDDIHHLGGAHFGYRFSNILHFELAAFGGLARAVRAVANRAFVEINILGILLRPGAAPNSTEAAIIPTWLAFIFFRNSSYMRR